MRESPPTSLSISGDGDTGCGGGEAALTQAIALWALDCACSNPIRSVFWRLVARSSAIMGAMPVPLASKNAVRSDGSAGVCQQNGARTPPYAGSDRAGRAE